MKKTAFLPGLSPKLAGSQRRSQLDRLQREKHQALKRSITDLGVLFNGVLPIDWLASIATDKRVRCFPQVVVFWAWLSQVLDLNASCSKGLNLIQKWFDSAKLTSPSFDTSSYCKARVKLPTEFLEKINPKVSSHLSNHATDQQLWYGHRLKSIDGTSVKLMDTAENQEAYPQPSNRAMRSH